MRQTSKKCVLDLKLEANTRLAVLIFSKSQNNFTLMRMLGQEQVI
jgi:hypothetical protein